MFENFNLWTNFWTNFLFSFSFLSQVEQIQTEYKKLALELHPDKNRGDKDAEAKFQKIQVIVYCIFYTVIKTLIAFIVLPIELTVIQKNIAITIWLRQLHFTIFLTFYKSNSFILILVDFPFWRDVIENDSILCVCLVEITSTVHD